MMYVRVNASVDCTKRVDSDVAPESRGFPAAHFLNL